MTEDTKNGEVISFEEASHPHVHARKDEKLKKLQRAFKAVTSERFKTDRVNRRKNKGKKKKR